jgi:putative restriction endonuclease
MTEEEVCSRFAQLKLYQKDGKKAPHKPLLLMLALGRVVRGEPQFAEFERELAQPLGELIRACWFVSSPAKPEYPFWRLRTDGGCKLWLIPEAPELLQEMKFQRSRDVSRHRLARSKARGGFADDVDEFLRDNPKVATRLAGELLAQYIDPAQHDRVRQEIGNPPFRN